MCIQREDRCWPVLDNAHARVVMAVDLSFVALGQAKESFEVEIVTDLSEHIFTHEEAR